MRIVVAPTKAARCKEFDNVEDCNSYLLGRAGNHAVIIDGELLGVVRSDILYEYRSSNETGYQRLNAQEVQNRFTPVAT